MIWSSRERNRSCSLVSRRSRGRIANPPLHQLERAESRLAIRRNPQNRICKEVALQRPKTGKFDYLSAPNHPAQSMAFKFFTDDDGAVTDHPTQTSARDRRAHRPTGRISTICSVVDHGGEFVSRDLDLWACQRGAAMITGSERSGTSSGRSTSYPNTNSLNLRIATGKLHLQRQNIDAHKIRTRAIQCDERRHLQRQALFVIGGGYPRFLDSDLAIFRRRRQLDRRKWAGRTVRPHVDIHPHTNIRVRFPTRHAADALH